MDVVRATTKEIWTRVSIKKDYERPDFEFLYSNAYEIFGITELSDYDELKKRFAKYLYEGNLREVKRILSNNNSQTINILPDGYYSVKGIKYPMSDDDVLLDYIKEGDIIFVRFNPNLNYNDYLSYVEMSSKLSYKTKNPVESGIFIDISFSLEQKLLKWDFNIFR